MICHLNAIYVEYKIIICGVGRIYFTTFRKCVVLPHTDAKRYQRYPMPTNWVASSDTKIRLLKHKAHHFKLSIGIIMYTGVTSVGLLNSNTNE